MLKCIPYQVPGNVEVGKTVTIKFGVQNLYNQPVDVVIFLAYCGNDSRCYNPTIVWKSGIVTINSRQTLPVTLNVVFKHDGYFGIGVYNHTLRRFECGFIIQATEGAISPISEIISYIQFIINLPIMFILIWIIKTIINLVMSILKS